jgi:hypothetical protein
VFDQHFHDDVVRAARERAETLLARGEDDLAHESHRELMRGAKVLLSLVVADGLSDAERRSALDAVLSRLTALRSLQSGSGLFAGGDNIQSPPDSAFTINDACDAHELLAPLRGEASVDSVLALLETIIGDATEPLVTGGVHTPNHRWEISAALARIHRSFPDDRLVRRIHEWLAEGVDVDADGLYSERSPNYAAHVTNPSLHALARILRLPELDAIVVRNLEATLLLIRPDDTVETIQSRRQDQMGGFPLSAFVASYRRAAVTTGRSDFASAAVRAARSADLDPELLAETQLDATLVETLPHAVHAPERSSYFLESIGMAGRRSEGTEAVVYAGSDYPRHRMIRSGLANNPTFCRVFAGEAILDSVRLSRAFFDMGPFRPGSIRRESDVRYRLEETVEAAYYQPLRAEDRAADGRYDLLDDGRFSASMAFPLRPRDVVAMTTVADVRLRQGGVDIELRIDAPPIEWSLDFVFRPGGVVEGGVRHPDGCWVLESGRGAYRVGESRILIDVEGAQLSERPLPYQPGQDYGFLGATDVPAGVRVRVGGAAPCSFLVRIRADQESAR